MTAQDIIDKVDKRLADLKSDDPVLKSNATLNDASIASVYLKRDVQLVLFAFHYGVESKT
ncbi:hypothetical protein LCGC14_3124300 [marine sediment metagenome]|uniref:Uncharacterized protein n=1 Tax=marine sediment metagenome TaxID=412755 RepID=A0A0F8YR64_9ZZZZ